MQYYFLTCIYLEKTADVLDAFIKRHEKDRNTQKYQSVNSSSGCIIKDVITNDKKPVQSF